MKTIRPNNPIYAYLNVVPSDVPLVVRPSRVPGARWEKYASTLLYDENLLDFPFFWQLTDLTGTWFDDCLGQVRAHRRKGGEHYDNQKTRVCWSGAIYVDSFGDYATPKQAMAELEQRFLRGDGATEQARQQRYYERVEAEKGEAP